MTPLLILGIDPGTTVGVALFDLEGRLVFLDSFRNISPAELVSRLLSFGRIVLVGTDVAPPPKKAEELAIRLGARLVTPSADLRVEQKQALAQESGAANAHQRDAFVAAVLAWRKHRTLIQKVDAALVSEGKPERREHVLSLLLGPRLMTLQQALGSLDTTPPSLKVRRKKVRSDPPVQAPDEVQVLQRKNRQLQRLLDYSAGTLHRLRQEMDSRVERRVRTTLKFRTERLMLLQKAVAASQEREAAARAQMDLVTGLLFRTGENVFIRKAQSFQDPCVLDAEGVLYVKDTRHIDRKALRDVQSRVSTLLVEANPPAILKEYFSLVNAQEVGAEDFGDFVVVEKARLEACRPQRELLAAIVRQYKKERGS